MTRHLIRVYRQRGDKRSPYVVAEEIAVSHPIVFKRVGRQSTIGGIPINHLESTGRRNHTRFQIMVRKGTTARGLRTSRNREAVEAEATAVAVKRVCRRLRDQEAEEIDRIDAEIAELEDLVTEARDRREDRVRRAWGRANVVRLAEMEERARPDEGERRAR
jgi:hypothetical protein